MCGLILSHGQGIALFICQISRNYSRRVEITYKTALIVARSNLLHVHCQISLHLAYFSS